jgi:hypothetical protein
MMLELAADIAAEKYARTRSHRDLVRLQDARKAALNA